MPRPRLLISDFTGGEVSPRVQARAGLERYERALKRCENFVIAQQGGLMLRRGTEYVGDSVANGATPEPEVAFIPWRGSSADRPDIEFELSGNTLRGWTNDGLILSGGIPYVVVMPVTGFADAPIQYAQSGKRLAIVNGVEAPMIITVNATDSWTVEAIPSATYPTRQFEGVTSPPRQDAQYAFTFTGFSAGNTYTVWVDGRAIPVSGRFPPAGLKRGDPQPFTYATSVATNISILKNAIKRSPSVPDISEVTITELAGVYTITMTGSVGGVSVNLVASAESATLRIAVVTNAEGRNGEERAWSYPTVVLYSGNYYQCILANISDAVNTPDVTPTEWLLLGPVAPYYEPIQPSETWSNASISYSPGGRGFPSCVAFHEQRMIVAGSAEAPKAIWGSALGQFTSFVLGTEDDDAWTIDLDAQHSPYVRWLASNNGLVVGTTDGIWVLTAQTTLSAADIQATPYSGDRVEAYQAIVAGNELMYIAQGARQLRSLRWNEQSGPYETIEISALAEHLARYGLRQLVYAHHPQPMIYARTSQEGLVVGITYNRQGDLLAFQRFQFNAEILSMSVMFDADDGDVLWLVMRRGTRVTIERMPYPVTDAPVDAPDTTATVHLDGWVVRTSAGGLVSGLGHLTGRSVTALDSAGAVHAVGVVGTGFAPTETPLVVSNAGFEAGPGVALWVLINCSTSDLVTPAPVHSGTYAYEIPDAGSFVGAAIQSNAIVVTAGKTYRARCWYYFPTVVSYSFPLYVRCSQNLPNVTLAYFYFTVASGPSATWQQAEIEFVAPAGTNRVNLLAELLGGNGNSMVVDDFSLVEVVEAGPIGEDELAVVGTDLVIGEPFLGRAITVEPAVGNPAGTSMGNKKRWPDMTASLYQSALPLLNGERPSDYEQAGGAYRDNPGALRTGEYKINSAGWDNGAVTIEQDLPHATQVIGIFGDVGVGVG